MPPNLFKAVRTNRIGFTNKLSPPDTDSDDKSLYETKECITSLSEKNSIGSPSPGPQDRLEKTDVSSQLGHVAELSLYNASGNNNLSRARRRDMAAAAAAVAPLSPTGASFEPELVRSERGAKHAQFAQFAQCGNDAKLTKSASGEIKSKSVKSLSSDSHRSLSQNSMTKLDSTYASTRRRTEQNPASRLLGTPVNLDAIERLKSQEDVRGQPAKVTMREKRLSLLCFKWKKRYKSVLYSEGSCEYVPAAAAVNAPTSSSSKDNKK